MKVLIVDDEYRLSNALVEMLNKNKIMAEAVYDGEDGLEYALTGNYDIILLDIMLPKMSGYEVLQKIREKGISTPVLLISARGEVSDKIKGLDIGGDDYITKPFDTGELIARMRAMTRRKGEYVGTELAFGDIILDKNTRELKGPTAKIAIGVKEYEIMEMLMSNAGSIIEKEKFVQKIWGYDSEAEYNTIEVYISFLRRKLESIKSCVQIKSVRGVGYKLEQC